MVGFGRVLLREKKNVIAGEEGRARKLSKIYDSRSCQTLKQITLCRENNNRLDDYLPAHRRNVKRELDWSF